MNTENKLSSDQLITFSVQSTNDNLEKIESNYSSRCSSPNNQNITSPLIIQNGNLDNKIQLSCSKCICVTDCCDCEPPKNRQKACSLTLENENLFKDYSKTHKNYFQLQDTKRSFSVSVPTKKNLVENNEHIQTEHLNLMSSNCCTSKKNIHCTIKNTPSIHISENPLSDKCSCSNHKNGENHIFSVNQSPASSQISLKNSNQLINNFTSNNTSNHESMQTITYNLVNSSNKTSSKDSIYQNTECINNSQSYLHFKVPSSYSLNKCDSTAQPSLVSPQNQNLNKRSSVQISTLAPARSPSSTSNNLLTHGRQDRLFSVGPSFHIQLKHPSSFGWKHRTKLEKKLVNGLAFSLVFFIIILVGSHLYRSYLNQKNQICMSAECVKTASSLLSAMDLNVNPCEDFFQYACGNWNKKHIISEDRSSISTFEVMADNLQIILKGLLEEPISASYDNSATIKAKTFYKSCMKIEKIEEIHDTPLKEVIQNLGGWPVLNENWIPINWKKEELLARLRAELNQGTIFEMWIGADDKNSTVHIIQIDQISLGLSSREYYLKPSSKKERDAYLKLMIEVAILLGAKREYAEKEMKKVLDFEIKLANASMPEADRHDTGAIYRKLSIKELQSIIKEIDWLLYFNKTLPTKVDLDEPIAVYSLSYLLEVGKILEKTEIKIIHNYLIWRLVRYFVPYLARDYVSKRIDFRKVMLGVSAERIRWTQCVEMVNKRLGMAVGTLFIKDHFDPQAKKTALEMIKNIREAFNELLDENEWMDNLTKQVAKLKANEMNERIGYPSLLTNPMELSNEFIQLQVYEDQFLLNIFNLLKFEANKNLIKLRQPVNKDKWTTEPAVVNAFYNPNKNDIVFPAGILQPFFYSAHFPKSLNYGGIGVVIGHEITHGFDERGRQFDREGNMKLWWENSTINEFRKRAQCIIDQYSSFVLEEVGYNINGKMTQGENIADNGGLKQSFRAFKKFEAKNGVEPLLPGLNMTHDQLFFLNYAQIWCGTMRPQDAINKIHSSVHSPGPIRVLGPLSNSYDFARSFNCPVGSRMNPKKKCSVW